jgi:hypothetical protein
MESIFGGLIQFEQKEKFDKFIESLDKENALKIIEMSLLFSQKNGMFSFEESHIIYKCISKLKSTNEPTNES